MSDSERRRGGGGGIALLLGILLVVGLVAWWWFYRPFPIPGMVILTQSNHRLRLRHQMLPATSAGRACLSSIFR